MVVGIGSRPATDWLVGSGVALDNGVVCDEVGRASEEHVWALGDVASWRDAVGHQIRVEHWSNVGDQARVMVPAMLGQEPRGGGGALSGVISTTSRSSARRAGPGDVVHVVEGRRRRFHFGTRRCCPGWSAAGCRVKRWGSWLRLQRGLIGEVLG